jgi:hypothetical protein
MWLVMLSKILVADLGVRRLIESSSNAIERMQGFFAQLFNSQGKVSIVIKLYA